MIELLTGAHVYIIELRVVRSTCIWGFSDVHSYIHGSSRHFVASNYIVETRNTTEMYILLLWVRGAVTFMSEVKSEYQNLGYFPLHDSKDQNKTLYYK